jgi:plasmid stabilization system protein ParE
MAKEVIWSEQAINDRKQILAYWIVRNQSKLYSIKLDALFREAVSLLSQYPSIGKPTSIRNVRAKKVRDYFIFYQGKNQQIHILTIWDTRQSPFGLRKKLKKGSKK